MTTATPPRIISERQGAAKGKTRLRFSTVLVVTIVCLVGVSVLTSIGILNRYFSKRVELEFQNKLHAQKGQVEILINNRLAGVQESLVDLSSDNTIRVTLLLKAEDQLKEGLARHLRPGQGVYPFIRKVNGGSILPETYPGLSQEFLSTLFNLPPEGDLFFDGTRTRLLWLLASPIMHNESRMGVAYVLYDLMEDGALQKAVIGAVEGEIVVLYQNTPTSLSSGKALAIDANMLRAFSERREYSAFGDRAISKIPGNDHLFLVSSLERLEEGKRHARLLTGAFSAVALLISMLISVYLGRKMVRPLSEMTDKAIRISEGETSLAFESNGTFWEFHRLSQAFTTMLANLKQAEERSRYQELLEKVEDAVYLIDADGRVLDANSAAYERLGYEAEEFYRLHLETILPAQEAERILAQLRPDGSNPRPEKLSVETLHFRKEGGTIPVEIHSRPILYQGRRVILNVARDISPRIEIEKEKKELEAQLIHSQKMEAIGTLAGGVAHDFNNLLMGIQGRLSLIRMQSDSEPNFGHHVDAIEKTVRSAADLTRQLLGFARKGNYEIKPTATNTLVEETTRMFIRTRKEIHLKLELGEGVRPVNVDRNQIEQVLINLYVNAWQAMPQGGELRIRTENVRPDEAFCRRFEVAGGDFVRISVSDTGIGMDAPTMARIFEPFFTTKAVGEGTGLGLASAYGTIRNHKGVIRVESEPGRGSTFEVYLPALSGEVPVATAASARRLPRGEGTILLADDDEEALMAESVMLEELGYSVVKARSGLQAVHLYREEPARFLLVMLDMVMPGLSGSDTCERLRWINPDVRILLVSGYGLNQQAGEMMTQGCIGFLPKPFETPHLAEKLHEVLGKE